MTSVVPDVAVDALNAAALPNTARDAAPDSGNIFDGVLAEVIATAGNKAGGGEQEELDPSTSHDEVDPTALVNESVVVAVPVSPAQIWNLLGMSGKTDAAAESSAVASTADVLEAVATSAVAVAPDATAGMNGIASEITDDAPAAIDNPAFDAKAASVEDTDAAALKQADAQQAQATTVDVNAVSQKEVATTAAPTAEQIAAMIEQDTKPRSSNSTAHAPTAAPKQSKRGLSAINTADATKKGDVTVVADATPAAVTNVQRAYSTEDRDASRSFSQSNELIAERRVQANQPMATVSFAVPVDAASMLDRNAAATIIEAPATAAAIDQAVETHLPQQIVQSIRMQALNGGGEAVVRLRPDYLGEVVVAVKVDQGSVTAAVHADTPQVRQWAERNEAVLRESLAQQGLQLDRLTVSDKPSETRHERESHRQQPRDEQPRQQSRRRRANAGDATFEVTV